MGCDIHGFIEYTHKDISSDSPYWRNFGGEFYLDRWYGFFGALAGVRRSEMTPVVPLRGLPVNMAYRTQDRMTYLIQDEPEDGSGPAPMYEGYVTKENAEKWLKDGYSKPYNDDPKRITSPDLHSYGWVTVEEFEKALHNAKSAENIDDSRDPRDSDYDALLAAMKVLSISNSVRFVFAFDS